LFVAEAKHVPDVQKALANYFEGPHKPAACWVETALPVPGALVAMDAVAVSDSSAPAGAVNYFRSAGLGGGKSSAHVSVLPAGRRIYISGQADRGTLGEATTRTLQSLEATLNHLKLA